MAPVGDLYCIISFLDIKSRDRAMRDDVKWFVERSLDIFALDQFDLAYGSTTWACFGVFYFLFGMPNSSAFLDQNWGDSFRFLSQHWPGRIYHMLGWKLEFLIELLAPVSWRWNPRWDVHSSVSLFAHARMHPWWKFQGVTCLTFLYTVRVLQCMQRQAHIRDLRSPGKHLIARQRKAIVGTWWTFEGWATSNTMP